MIEHSLAHRWARWQQTTTVQRSLAPGTDLEHFTVLYVPPSFREAFFLIVVLFFARHDLERAMPRLLEKPPLFQDLQRAQTAWRDWLTWTRRLTAYTQHITGGQHGDCPELPESLADLVAVLGGNDSAT
jgi:hypothetical protein